MSAFLGTNFEDNGEDKEALSNFGYIGSCFLLQMNSPVRTDKIRIIINIKYNIRGFILYIFSFVNVLSFLRAQPYLYLKKKS